MDSKEAFRNYLKTGARIGESMEKTFKAGYQAALASQAQQPNAWQQAIDDELVNAHLGIACNEVTREEAKIQLNKLIAWHIDVAKYFELQAQQSAKLVQYRQKDGTVWFYQSIEDTLPSWACDVKPYTPPAPEGDKE